jgi:hypothetical protein
MSRPFYVMLGLRDVMSDNYVRRANDPKHFISQLNGIYRSTIFDFRFVQMTKC